MPRNSPMLRRRIALLIPLIACGCPTNCPEDDDPVVGLVISARNSGNGIPIVNPTITLTDGAYQETMIPRDPTGITFMGAVERAGTYTVTIQKEGFKTTTVQNVNVPQRFCHVQTQTLTVNIPPQ
jgi:hypothetical protein